MKRTEQSDAVPEKTPTTCPKCNGKCSVTRGVGVPDKYHCNACEFEFELLEG
jgi:hypothetical protein